MKTLMLTLTIWLAMATTAFASATPVAGAAKSAGKVFGFLVIAAIIVAVIMFAMRAARRRT